MRNAIQKSIVLYGRFEGDEQPSALRFDQRSPSLKIACRVPRSSPSTATASVDYTPILQALLLDTIVAILPDNRYNSKDNITKHVEIVALSTVHTSIYEPAIPDNPASWTVCFQITFHNPSNFKKVRTFWRTNFAKSLTATGILTWSDFIETVFDGQPNGVPEDYKFLLSCCDGGLKSFDGDLPPLVQFFHQTDINPNGWIQVNKSAATTIGSYTYAGNRESQTEYGGAEGRETIFRPGEAKLAITPLPDKSTIVPWKLSCIDFEMTSLYTNFPVPHRNSAEFFYQPWLERLWAALPSTILEAYESKIQDTVVVDFITEQMIQEFIWEPVQPSLHVVTQWVNSALVDFRLQSNTPGARKPKTTLQPSAPLSLYHNSDEEDHKNGDGDDDAGEDSDHGGNFPELLPVGKAVAPSCKPPDIGNGIQYYMENTVDRLGQLKSFRYAGDPITYMGLVKQNYSDLDVKNEKKICFVTNQFCYNTHTKKDGIARIESGKYDGDEYVAFESEIEMIEGFLHYFSNLDPDVILGYNIQGFDYCYMVDRAFELYKAIFSGNPIQVKAKMKETFGNLGRSLVSRIADYQPKYMQHERSPWLTRTTPLIRGKKPEVFSLSTPGRIQLDLMLHVKRQFDLPVYSLDAVACTNLCDTIVRVEIIDENRHMVLTSKYTTDGVMEMDFVQLYYDNMRRINIAHKWKVVRVTKKELFLEIPNADISLVPEKLLRLEAVRGAHYGWGLVKDDLPPQTMRLYSMSSSLKERLLVGKYCLQDCSLVIRIFHKIDVWTGLTEMVRLCRVPMDTILQRGLGQRLTSFVAFACAKLNRMMPDIVNNHKDDVNTTTTRKAKYQGAFVIHAETGAYIGSKQCITLDYNSLYPTTMCAHNLCNSTKLYVEKIDRTTCQVKEKYDANAELLKFWTETDPEFGPLASYLNTLPRNLDKHSLPKEIVSYRAGIRLYIVQDENEKTNTLDRSFWIQPLANAFLSLMNGTSATSRLGVLPQITTELLEGRNIAKKKKAAATNDVDKAVFDNRQLKLKEGANSIYGQTGSEVSSFSDIHVAAAITRLGRASLEYTVAAVKYIFRDRLIRISASRTDHCKTIVPRLDNIANYYTWSKDLELKEILEYWRLAYETFLETCRPIEYALYKDIVCGALHGHFALENTNGFLEYVAVQKQYMTLDDNGPLLPWKLGCALIADGEGTVAYFEIKEHEGEDTILRIEGGKCIYGDTDSVFIHFPSVQVLPEKKTVEDVPSTLYLHFTLGHWMAAMVSMFLPPPMKLVFEKSFRNFIMLGKKRYFGLKYENSFEEYDPKCTGLNMKKKDSCDYAKDLGINSYCTMIRDFHPDTKKYMSADERITLVLENFVRIVHNLTRRDFNQYPPTDLLLTKSLNNKYAKPYSIMQWVLANRMRKRDPGSAPKPGDRVRFLIVIPPTAKSDYEASKMPMTERIESYDYWMQLSPEQRPPIDLRYYIHLQLLNPLLILFRIFFSTVYGYFATIKGLNEEEIVKNLKDHTCLLDKIKENTKATEKYLDGEIVRIVLTALNFQATVGKVERQQNKRKREEVKESRKDNAKMVKLAQQSAKIQLTTLIAEKRAASAKRKPKIPAENGEASSKSVLQKRKAPSVDLMLEKTMSTTSATSTIVSDNLNPISGKKSKQQSMRSFIQS